MQYPPPIVRQPAKDWTAERRLFRTILIQSYARRLLAKRVMGRMLENALDELPELASGAEDEGYDTEEELAVPDSPREVWRLKI